MSRGHRRKEAQAKIAQLTIRKRSGIVIAVASVAIMALLIAIKLNFQMQGAAWANTQWASMGIFICAIVAAGFAGYGTRTWKRSNDEIKRLQGKLK